jgi:integrase
VAAGKSPQTVWHVRTALTTIFKEAKRIGWYSGDVPTEGIEMPELQHRERTALTREQLVALLAGLPSPSREATLVLSLTGLRRAELEGLRRRRANLTDSPVRIDGEMVPACSIAVREAYVRVYGKQVDAEQKGGRYQGLKSKRSRRNVPLLPLAAQVLEAVMNRSKFTDPNDPVFASRVGTPIDLHNELNRRLHPVTAELKLPAIGWHDLRHTASTLADQAGLTEAERQRILGHADLRMTRHYTHAHLEHVRSAMGGMAQGLEDAVKNPKVVEFKKKSA